MKSMQFNKIVFLVFPALLVCNYASSDQSNWRDSAIPIKNEPTSAPAFLNLGSLENNSSLSMECVGNPPFINIHCTFTQLTIRKDSEKEINETVSSMDEALKNEKESKIKEAIERACVDLNSDWVKKLLSGAKTEAKKKSLEQDKKLAEEICACNNGPHIPLLNNKKECFRKAYLNSIRRDASKCKISVNTFEKEFKKVGSRKWMSDVRPSGLCDFVNSFIIEHDKTYPNLWTYTQVRLSADKDTEFCRGFTLNEPQVYSWSIPADLTMSCENIDFVIF